ncbi:MAG: YihY/virulence factor BrkB family protein [Rudaea sp.]
MVDRRSVWKTIKDAGEAFFDHDALTLSAALAFYMTLSFAPTIALSLWVAASLGHDAQKELLGELALFGGHDVRLAAEIVVDHAKQNPGAGTIAGVIGIIVLIVSASAVFAQLQSSLNFLWSIKPTHSTFAWQWIQQRLLSVGMLAAGIFMLIVTLVVSAVLTWIFGNADLIWKLVNQFFALAVFTLMFAVLFRYLPARRIALRHAMEGGFITATLFTAGKFLIGQYLAHSNVGGSYGPAGAFIVLLVWVYYSSVVFFFGAEIVGARLRCDEQTGVDEKPV